MRFSILFVVLLSLSSLARTQERTAHVVLENGTELSGRVVSMDLKQLQLVVGEEIVTISAADIKTCRFQGAPKPANPPPAAPVGEVAPVTVPQTEAGAETEPVEPSNAEAPTAAKPTAVPAPGPLDWLEPDFELESAAPPESGSLLDRRIKAVDELYPWLRPSDPLQWISLGLLLLSGLSLIIHISVVVAGAEAAAFVRSVGLSILYLVAAFAQVALVPSNDFGVFSMLIGNTAVVLFAVRGCFELARSSAFVAFAVQVGFVAVGFGVLELIDALLGSVATA